MKKLYTLLLAVLLLAFLAVGVYSLVDQDATESIMENRKLAEKPEFSWASLLDGSYISALETYYSDTFPGRDTLLKLNKQLNQFYYYSGTGGDNLLVLDYQGGAEQGGESIRHPDDIASTAPDDLAPEPDQTPVDTPPQEEDPAESTDPVPPEEPEKTDDEDYTEAGAGNIIITKDRAMDIPTASNDIILRYAEAINNLHAALGADVQIVSLLTPNSSEFYAPPDFQTEDHDQRAMIDLCYGAMAEDIVKVDAYSALEAHQEEYIYFRTDHHWTALGAYYAYTAFCQAMDLEAVALEEFESGIYEDFVGSMYTYTSGYPQSAVLQENPDILTYYLPIVETHAKYYADADLENSTGYPVSVVYTQEELSNKYLCFVGGDHPVTVIETAAEGPVCMVLKESYGNAFLPFLTSHYSKIIAVDPREFNQDGKPSLDLAAFAQEQGVDQLIVVNYPFMINSLVYTKWLNRLVGLDLESAE